MFFLGNFVENLESDLFAKKNFSKQLWFDCVYEGLTPNSL